MCDISPNNVSLQIQSDYYQKQNHRMMTHLTDISKMKTKKLLITILLALPFCMRTLGCTLMIVAASATEDGRPMLFKN